jgi:hypothetical protein
MIFYVRSWDVHLANLGGCSSNFVPSDGNLRGDNSKVGQEAGKPGIARFDIPDCFTLVFLGRGTITLGAEKKM